MSKLEEKTMPILTPLIRGEASALEPAAQRTLATWITKTLMVVEFSGEDVATPPIERLYLKDVGEPPSNWKIWIAHYRGEDWTTGYLRHSATLAVARSGIYPPPPPKPFMKNTQSNIFGIGELFVQTISSTLIGVDLDVPAEAAHFTRKIWPLANDTVLWPPSHILNDLEARFISRAFARFLEAKVEPLRAP